MKVWSIQTEAAYQKLLEKGMLYGDWRRVWKHFKKPYKWLCDQMEQRDIPLKGRPPMWAWTTKPDLRSSYHLEKGEKGVRLELEVPDELVLVSNFEAWHCVLNDHFVVTNDDELEMMFNYPRSEVEASWQKIFQLEHINALPGYSDRAQATFPLIELDRVVRSTAFVSR